MQTPLDSDRTYQIFKREADNTTVCVEVVKGLHEARNRIEEARTASPGSELFIFDPLTQKTVDPSEPASTADPLTTINAVPKTFLLACGGFPLVFGTRPAH